MMTSQDHICVQSVTKSLRQKRFWNSTNNCVMHRSCFHVLCVKNVLLLRITWGNIWMFTAVNTSALNAESVFNTIKHYQYTDEFILERNRLNVLFVVNGSVDHLAKHSRIHSGEKPYKCRECDKAFSVPQNLTSHMRVHTGDKPYKCSLCDKSFRQSSHLQKHKRYVHSNRRPYDCRYCGRMFKSSGELKHHVYTHTGAKPYACRHCSDCFRRQDHLKAHLVKSHNEGIWFTCHICQKKFSVKSNLKQHILCHEGVKPYFCEECLKSFCTAAELKRHQLKHSGYKQFCCGSCGKYFKLKVCVVRHFNRCSVEQGYVNIFARHDWNKAVLM